MTERRIEAPKRIGMVSLGCPKALVDSERILSRLRAEGYEISPSYAGSDAVIVNTCGFLDSAKAESLEAIGEAIAANGKVIVTGCLGEDADAIRAAHPKALAITGQAAFDDVMDAVRRAAPQPRDPFVDLTPAARARAVAPEDAIDDPAPLAPGARLTPAHYAYLKIAEGCAHKCRFCIIPSMRGRLVSRPAAAVIREAVGLVEAGARELLVIAQDVSAYGRDLRHAASRWRDADYVADIASLARSLGEIEGPRGRPWVRLHYVYPYPHVDRLIPLMAEGVVTPYLDMPLQHASPSVLKAMRRPADQEKTLDRIASWRAAVPDIALRSTFIVGFPGETEADFELLLEWLDEARLDRVGCFQYENVAGAAANALPRHLPQEVKEERWRRFMERAQAISAEKLSAKIGRKMDVIVDKLGADAAEARSQGDAPEIDGLVLIDEGFENLTPGEIVSVEIRDASEYDLFAARV